MADCRRRRAIDNRIINVELCREKPDLASAIAEGDIRVLLIVQMQTSSDLRRRKHRKQAGTNCYC